MKLQTGFCTLDTIMQPQLPQMRILKLEPPVAIITVIATLFTTALFTPLQVFSLTLLTFHSTAKLL